MYIIEKLIQFYLKITQKNNTLTDYSENQDIELEDVITCKHVFMPIDSTGKIFACNKCGYVVTQERINKNKNFFED